MNIKYYKSRREKLGEYISDGIAIISSASFKNKSHDTDFPFRQDSNFFYFTGFNEAESLLILKYQSGNLIESIIFVQEKDPKLELWMGKRLGVEQSSIKLEVDLSHSIKELTQILPDLFLGHKNIFFDFYNKELRELIFNSAETCSNKKRVKKNKPIAFHNITPLIGKMRLIKDESEIQIMKECAKITNLGHRAAMAMASHRLSEKEIQDTMEYVFKKNGANGVAYDSIVAGGENALTLHYIENNKGLKDGDLLLIDAGSEIDYYASDVTRTFPVNGKFTPAQKEIYQVVLEAQKKAIAMVRPGITLTDIHNETCNHLILGLMDLKVLQGSLEEEKEKGDYKKLYPHSTSHWLGLDVHDKSPYVDDLCQDIILSPGMVITIEPGLYLNPKNGEIPAQYHHLGIRIEDDILVTEAGHENLTRDIPKDIADIEKACHHHIQDFL